MSTRKIASMASLCGMVTGVTLDGEAKCEISMYYGQGSFIEAKGTLDKYQLHSLAIFAITSLEAIEKQERDRANYTANILAKLRGAR